MPRGQAEFELGFNQREDLDKGGVHGGEEYQAVGIMAKTHGID